MVRDEFEVLTDASRKTLVDAIKHAVLCEWWDTANSLVKTLAELDNAVANYRRGADK